MIEARKPTEEGKDPLLSLAVHEFRSPVTVIAGYLRMVLGDRAGTLNEKQQKMLHEVEKSVGRLSGLIAELSDLSHLEGGGAKFTRGSVDLAALLTETIAELPPLTDGRVITVTLQNHAPGATVEGDRSRLRTAFTSLLYALKRELVSTDELRASLRRVARNGKPTLQIAIGGSDRIESLEQLAPADLQGFDDYRIGGIGFTLPMAHRILDRHRGELWSPNENPKAGAIVVLPEG